MILQMGREAYAAMAEHAAADYPCEACGLLVGRLEEGRRHILQARRARNLNEERAHDRFELDPKDYLQIDRELRGTGLEILGVYHSHPDHPAEPSRYDRERAWPAYSYVIVSVAAGRVAEARSWLFDESRGEFDPEALEVLDA